MNDAEARSLESKIWATSIIPIKAHPEIPKYWHHYLCTKLTLIKREQPMSKEINYQSQLFLKAVGVMAKKYPIDSNSAMYNFYIDYFESARDYQDKKNWDVH